MTFKFAIYEFSDREINQIVSLITSWVQNLKIDQRTLTPQVRYYGQKYGFLPVNPKRPVFVLTTNPDVLSDVPVEAIFRTLQPAFHLHSGYTITRDLAWRKLNISKDDITTMEKVLYKLDQEGYITFQSAGNIWRFDLKSMKG